MSAPDSLAWLGLLRWSLQYNDGTTPSGEPMAPLSLDKKLFLEKVMNECVQDDNKRIGDIIKEIVSIQAAEESSAAGSSSAASSHEVAPSASTQILPLLMELHDLLDQIDYSLSFAQQGGLPFILSFIDDDQQRSGPPLHISVKLEALDMLSTVLQNNPEVQSMFISPTIRGLDRICSLLLQEASRAMSSPSASVSSAAMTDDSVHLLLKFYLTLSSCVRNHPDSEQLFLNAPNKRGLAILSLGVTWPLDASSPAVLLKCLKIRLKSTFLLRALFTSSYGYSGSEFKGQLLTDLVHFGGAKAEEDGSHSGRSLRIVENCTLTREGVAAGLTASLTEDDCYDLDVQFRELRRLSISTLRDIFGFAEQGAVSAAPPPPLSSTAAAGDLLDASMGDSLSTIRGDIVGSIASRAERLSESLAAKSSSVADDKDQTVEEIMSLASAMEVLRSCEQLYARRTGSAPSAPMAATLTKALEGLKGNDWYKEAAGASAPLPPKILSRKLDDAEDTSYSFLGGLAK